MNVKYDNGHSVRVIPLLDAYSEKTLSPKSVELWLVNTNMTFQVLLPEGYVDAEPVEITSLKKQPTIAEIQARFAPVNMPMAGPECATMTKPGTPLHDIIVRRSPAHVEVGVCRIKFRNGEVRDCYVYLRPTNDAERTRAMQMAEARRLAPEQPAPARKRRPGERGRRPSYTMRDLNNVEGSIRHHNGSLIAAARALGKGIGEVRRMHDTYRHRQRNLNPELRTRK